ncbi:MAG: hypothetical protein QM726_25420 [Chitinophagaceae bacterium]
MKPILFLLGCSLAFSPAKSQLMDPCQAFNYFISSDSVRNLLAFDANRTCWLYNAAGVLGKDTCAIGYSNNHHFKWVTDSVAFSQQSKNCAYYNVSCTRKGAGWFIEIWQSCSGLVCQGMVNKTKQKMAASSFTAFVR